MPTLILSSRYTPDSIALWRAAIAQGWEVERLVDWHCPADFHPAEPVLYAEPLFNAAIAEQLDLAIVAPAEDFLTRLPREYVQRDVRLMTAARARAINTPAFIKPPSQKTFPARVHSSGLELHAMPDEDPVLVSEPVEWLAELRFFIRERNVRAWSPYWLRGALARREDEWICEKEFAEPTRMLVERLLADERVSLPNVVVLDAGIIQGRGPAIVEANEASGAGLYGCDPVAVLEVLRAGTVRNCPQ